MNNTAVLFHNWSDEDFDYTWDSNRFSFPAGSSMYLEAYLAHHFTKHLVDREMNKAGIPTDHHTRGEYEAKCLGNVIESKSEVESKTAILNENADLGITPEAPAEEKVEVVEEKPKKGKKAKKDEFED